MKNVLEANQVGLTVGGVVGFWHLVWSALVAIGWAQSLFGWVSRLHMMEMSMTVLPFSLSSATLLVIIASLVGYAFGYVFATVWNLVQK